MRTMNTSTMNSNITGQKSILVIEDEEDIVIILDFLFKREGFSVSIARDGRAAEEIINGSSLPDVVVMDVMLPYFDGFHLIKKMRETENWKDVPVLMLTAKSEERDIVRGLDVGANDYMLKPFMTKELVARVRRLIK